MADRSVRSKVSWALVAFGVLVLVVCVLILAFGPPDPPVLTPGRSPYEEPGQRP